MKPIPSPSRLSGGILQAIDWLAAARQGSVRLNREADSLTLRLRRCYNRATLLDHAAQRPVAIGLYGHNLAAKRHLLAALAPGAEPLGGDAALTVRYAGSAARASSAYPIAITLLDETQLLGMTIGAALMDGFRPEGEARAIAARLQALARHRQAMAVDGMDSNAVVALWDRIRRHGGKWQPALDRHFWPQAVALAPHLSIDDRARLFAPLWGEDPRLTAHYRQLAYALHALGCSARLQAPEAACVLGASAGATLPVLTESGAALNVSQADLAWLAAEVTVPLPAGLPAGVELLDIPASAHCPGAEPTQRLQQAKRADLLARCAEGLHASLLLIADAVDRPQDAGRTGEALAYWVEQTQGESAGVRSRRKPGLIWAITPFDARREGKQRPDDAVQRHVGEPGDSWATLLATDERDCRRMAAYLAEQARPALKQARILERRQELRRELKDSLLGNWLTSPDPQRARRLLRALQAQAGAHGELLEWLLPQRDALRRLYPQPQPLMPAPVAAAPPFGVDVDLFGEEPAAAPAAHGGSPFAQRVFAEWVNHLRNLPDNAQLSALLGVDKPQLELLADALITAAGRLEIDAALERALAAAAGEDRQIGQALAILGDFVAWLGFQQRDAASRPASRINHGRPIFSPPPQPAVDWGNQQRLTKLAPTATTHAAFYIYDWLVGLQTLLAENAAAAPALEAAARAALEERVARMCDEDGA
ncbi:virulence factor SrfC family protein [Serratia ficaria]|uniref:virulence factor SrfC family protein n=1 Tax=Serratia ficaria TaxID=61651 RepID=UPI002179745C|nr:virulence factor SrfC family protein [Serratia ficaria]CAI0959727.1 Putative bacterial virulence factor [Serratia ficaria]CAI0987966.1 Putative bacterial virulence factor [Serratia ficaria]CAI1718915.1 Putative bacterial virulence factor [Serratia ficaria]CAI2458976.1 Putative bacterial virulence factor [Serratia ficaria]CAI2473100.1 Putative bacterial virulence factor [Serratia ficaria]